MVEGNRVMREYRITEGRLQSAGQRAKPEIADYVLVYRNRKLAVIEAKRRDLQEGVEELEQEKLTKLLRLKYHDSIPDAVADLGGDINSIRNLFSGFQRYLYQDTAAR